MPRWLRIVLWVVAVIVVIGGGLYYWFIFDSHAPGTPPAFTIDMARIRALAAETPGERPTEIRVAIIAEGSFPQTAVVAGEGWNGFPLGMMSYELVFPAGRTIVVDAGIDEAGAKGFGAAFHADAFATLETAMAAASEIVVTHEHPDHIGAILVATDPAIAPRLDLTVEQLANAGHYAGFTVPPGVLADAKPLAYDDYFALAPGVVLIKAPGHSLGSQLIYVARADGGEFLFVGDVGWSLRNIEEVRGRPRLVSQFMLGEDRDRVFGQLQALHDLHLAEPQLVIVPGHDQLYVQGLVDQGLMVAGFVEKG